MHDCGRVAAEETPPATNTSPRRLAGGVEAETLWLKWAHVGVGLPRRRPPHVHAVMPA